MPDPLTPEYKARLRELIARLETEEPGRELDAATAKANGNKIEIYRVPKDHPVFKEGGSLEFMVQTDGTRVGIPHHTSSIDAKLPGEDDGYWEIVGPLVNGRWHAKFTPNNSGVGHWTFATTEAMARRAAFLKSKLANQEARDDG